MLSLTRNLIATAVLSLASLITNANAQSSSESSSKIRAAVQSREWTTARAEIERLKSTDPDSFRRNDYEYLLGRIAENVGEHSTAAASFESVVTNNSRLSEYANWHLARIARMT